ncbi:MAG: hypothetical protein AB8B65_02600 [Kordia sp.]|uniref:hypothetical protein n=1 Tax=Kordia sp. TaxID=1965332 RepID=UPI00385C1FD9
MGLINILLLAILVNFFAVFTAVDAHNDSNEKFSKINTVEVTFNPEKTSQKKQH